MNAKFLKNECTPHIAIGHGVGVSDELRLFSSLTFTRFCHSFGGINANGVLLYFGGTGAQVTPKLVPAMCWSVSISWTFCIRGQ